MKLLSVSHRRERSLVSGRGRLAFATLPVQAGTLDDIRARGFALLPRSTTSLRPTPFMISTARRRASGRKS